MNWMRHIFALALVPGVASADPAPGSMQPYRDKNRIVLVAGPGMGDANIAAQRQVFQSHRAGFKERDLLFFEALGEPGARARAEFKLDGKHFTVLLIGKDGEVKVKSDKPLTADFLFGTIDAMPMRKEEMKRR